MSRYLMVFQHRQELFGIRVLTWQVDWTRPGGWTPLSVREGHAKDVAYVGRLGTLRIGRVK